MCRPLPALCLALALAAHAQSPHQPGADGLFGYWREPGGSIIQIAPCGSSVCATLVGISSQAPSQFDIRNPDPTLRRHRLCGLLIGRDFHLTNTTHAEGGTLYDPKSGKSYHGEMTATDHQLDLRGYVGIPLFGRSQTWTRTAPPPLCTVL